MAMKRLPLTNIVENSISFLAKAIANDISVLFYSTDDPGVMSFFFEEWKVVCFGYRGLFQASIAIEIDKMVELKDSGESSGCILNIGAVAEDIVVFDELDCGEIDLFFLNAGYVYDLELRDRLKEAIKITDLGEALAEIHEVFKRAEVMTAITTVEIEEV